MNALQDRDPLDETPQKHNCEEWRYEGIGCARCNPLVRAGAHGLRSLLRDAESENARLREHVAALREALDRIRLELGVPQPGYPAPVANAAFIARGALDWHAEEAKAAYEQGLRDT